MIGAVRDIDPCTGHHFDDTRRTETPGCRRPAATSSEARAAVTAARAR